MTKTKKSVRVGVLLGGISSERAVSLDTGNGVFKALKDLGYDAKLIDWKEGTNPASLVADAKVDVIWNALHGTFGEDGAVQGLLECLEIPYTGSGILASALAMDKVASKQQFETHDVQTPPWALARTEEDIVLAFKSWRQIAVKPSREGSSVGVSIVSALDQIPEAFALADACGGSVIVEKYIAGAELHIGILNGKALASVQVIPASGFYDYEAKYKRDDTQYLVPPKAPADQVANAETVALRAYRSLDCGGYGRVDLRMEESGAPWVLGSQHLTGNDQNQLASQSRRTSRNELR